MNRIRFSIRFFVLLLGISFGSCAQTKTGIIKAHAYMQLNIPGTIPVGDEHKGPDTLYRVYIESRADKNFIWSAAYIGNNAFNIISYKAVPPVTVGNLTSTGEAAVITTKKGNILWQLNLEKTSSKTQYSKNNTTVKEVILKMKSRKKSYFYKIKPILELQPELHM